MKLGKATVRPKMSLVRSATGSVTLYCVGIASICFFFLLLSPELVVALKILSCLFSVLTLKVVVMTNLPKLKDT